MAEPMRRILITHPTEARVKWYGERALTELASLGEVVTNPHDRVLTLAELVNLARDCTIIVSDRETPGEAGMFENLPKLLAYVRGQVDLRTVDVEAASAAGVLVTQASRGFIAAVAEWILGAMLAAGRSTVPYVESYRRSEQPPPIMGRQLMGSTVGVIGFGAIARHFCDAAAALGMRVLVHDPYQQVPPPMVQAELSVLYAEADFVVPLAPATEETENLINAAALTAMKPTAWLINASRGNLVDEAALERALDEGRIAGAALDVGRALDQMPSLHLARRADVIATPHIGGLTPEAIEHQAMETVQQTAAILKGDLPAGAVNAERASRFAQFRMQRV